MILTVINVYTNSMPIEISKHFRVYELICKFDIFMVLVFRVIYLIVVYTISLTTIKKLDFFI